MDSLVSVILPIRNSGEHLNDCLESLINQKHQNLEIIAIDDNSKDHSVKILKQFHKIDKRIKFSVNVKRYGLAISLNRALKKAKGEFITFMNPNDVNSVWRLKHQLDFLRKNPRVVAVGTQAVAIDEKGKTIDRSSLPHEHEHIYPNFLQGLAVQFESIMINKKRIPRDLLYFTHDKYPFIYIEVFMKLFKYGKFANLKKHLYYHRGLQITKSINNTEKYINHMLMAIKSFTIYDYRPSFRALVSPFTTRTKNRLGLN